MLLDIIYAVLLLLAIIHGFSRGLILGIFSLLAIIIGLAAALKLSTVVAGWIGSKVNISKEWLPFVAFFVVFLVVVLLIRLGAKAIEKTVQLAMLGWANRLGGILFYVVIYTLVFSVILFYAEQMHLIKAETIQSSRSYAFIQPWGPKVINALGSIIPFFKNMFDELQQFFARVATKM
jgi:membrane protein required for colicin V production